jgi:hypothetical protein
MSKAELKSARKVLEECLKRRINFTYQCCNNLIDVGHAYMIVNLNRKLEDCDYFLYERKLRRKENRRVKDNN